MKLKKNIFFGVVKPIYSHFLYLFIFKTFFLWQISKNFSRSFAGMFVIFFGLRCEIFLQTMLLEECWTSLSEPNKN